MSTSNSREIFQGAQQCYEQEYWSDALHHLDELSCDMLDDKDVIYMRALCLARLGRIEEADILCDQLNVVLNDDRGPKLKAQLEHAKRQEREKPKEKKAFKLPAFVVPSIIIIVAVILVDTGVNNFVAKAKNYAPQAVESMPAPNERTLKLGNALANGKIFTRKWRYDVLMPEERNNHWSDIGAAQGEIVIPLGHEVRLDLSGAV